MQRIGNLGRVIWIPSIIIAFLCGCSGPAPPEPMDLTALSNLVATPTESAPVAPDSRLIIGRGVDCVPDETAPAEPFDRLKGSMKERRRWES